jgi:hypothetical protein
MNELVPYAHKGEVIGPEEKVTIIGRPRLGKQGVIRRQLPAGHTVAELLDMALEGERSHIPTDYLTYVDGSPVPLHWRDRVRVKAGRTVTFSPALGGGDAWRSIAMIAVAVVAIAAAVFLPVLFPVIGTFAASLIGAGIAFAGSMAVNALFPVAPPKTSALEDQRGGVATPFSITGARNTSDPYGPIPTIFGRVRVWPRYAALPYTSFSGTDQYLRLLFCLGYGPLDIDELKIGETDIDSFEDVSYQIRDGYDDDSGTSLYPGQVFEDALSVELTEDADWQERTTAADIDEIEVDILAPGGWYELEKDTGKYLGRDLHVEAQYRESGTGDPWSDLGEYDQETKKKKPFRIGFSHGVSRGPAYDVRVRKAAPSEQDDPLFQEDLVWVALRGIRNDDPISFHKPLALVAIKIKASGQLNNVIDSFNCVVSARVNSFNGSSWDDSDDPDTWDESRNPADAFRHALQGPGIFEPVPDEQIDEASLEGWWEYCDDEGWEFNYEASTRQSVFDTLRMIAATGRARVSRTDGLWGVIWDEADPPVAQHFTPRNSWGFEEQRTYFNPPHALRVNFINEEKGYVADERKVYDDGYSSSNATRFEAIEFPGVTNTDNIYRLARFQMAQAQLRPATYSLMTNWQALSCAVGSRVYAAHDVTLWGITQGRVRSVGDSPLEVTLDEEVIFEAGVEYQLRFRQPDGTSVLRSVATPLALGATNVITLVESDVLPDPAAGDLFMFGNDTQGPAVLLRVLDIEFMPDLTARLTLVDDAPEISDADSGPIPPFDSQITAPQDLFLRPPTNLQVSERTYIEQLQGRSAAQLSWLANTERAQGFEVQMRDDAVGTFETVALLGADEVSTEIPDLDAGTYSFRVRSLFGTNAWSDWAANNGNSFTGVPRPADVENFRVSIVGDVATLTWNTILNVPYYSVRFSPLTDGTVTWATSVELLAQAFGSTVQVAAANGTYLIKAISVDGLESQNPAIVIALGAGLTNMNEVETVAEPNGSPGWAGTKLGCETDGNTLVLITDSPGLYVESPYPDDYPPLPVGTVAYGVYYFDDIGSPPGSPLNEGELDLGEIFTSRLSASITAFGNDTANVMASWSTLSEVLTLAGSLAAGTWAVILQERHTSDDPNGSPVTWSEWENLRVSDITARAFQFRLFFYTLNATIITTIESVEITIDMPDRVVPIGDLSVPDTGITVTFDPPFRHLSAVLVTAIQDAGTGDYAVVSNRSETGFDVIVRDAADAGVARTIDAVAHGYGRRLS